MINYTHIFIYQFHFIFPKPASFYPRIKGLLKGIYLIGILFGVVFLSSWERSMGISLGLIIGSGIGGAIGRSMDVKAKNEGRVL